MKFTRLNPVTGEVASEAEAMQAADMAAVAEKAQQGFEAWSKVGPNAAGRCCKKRLPRWKANRTPLLLP
jgi:acyl-CoA reductase-like NAD-dependent aldehyde dehydrogenase